MSFPTHMRDIVTELFLGGEWVDVSGDVMHDNGIEVTRGRSAEASSSEPAEAHLTLANRDGRYSMRNPLSPYYGLLGRNTPLRLSIRHTTDTAGTTVSNGWGSTDSVTPTGLVAQTYAWTSTGTASDYAKASGKATHAMATAGNIRISYLPAFDLRDVEVRCTVTVPVSNVTGGPIAPANIMLHGQGSASEYYFLRLVINTDESVQVDFFTHGGLSITSGFTTIPGLTHSAGQSLRVAFQIEGRTLRAKVWPANSDEPFGWHKTYSDNAIATRPTLVGTSGWVGIRSSLVAGNTNGPITFSYDDIEVRSYRFFGEVASWPSTRDTSGRDARVPITGNGVTRRLGKGEALQSALRRYLPGMSPRPVYYWPLEDDKGQIAEQVEAVVNPGVGRMAFYQNIALNGTISGSVRWAADTTLPGTRQAPSVVNGGRFEFNVPSDPMATNWSVFWAHKISYDADAQVYFYTASEFFTVYIVTYSDGKMEVYLSVKGTDTLLFTWTHPSGTFDDVWHTYVMNCTQSGGSVVFNFYVDGVLRGNTTKASTTMSGLRQVRFLTPPLNNSETFLAHVAAWDQTVSASTLHTVAFGYAGETAGARITRLCAEQGVPIEFVGDPAETIIMGGQRVESFMELIEDCEKADTGQLYEPKGTTGLAYRTAASLQNQTPIASMDLSTGQVAPPFRPVDDDRYLRNDVTAKRDFGGDYRYELTTGRMGTADPSQGGAGRYETSYEVNVRDDFQLLYVAGWQVHLGTVDEPRFPSLRVNFGNPDTASDSELVQGLLDASVGDMVEVVNASATGLYGDIEQHIVGYTEELIQEDHRLNLACAPASPHRAIVLDSTTEAFLDTETSTLNEDLDTTETGVDVATTGQVWSGADVPFEVQVGGEVMRVTAVTGASSPQTFTVVRSINGVVKSHATGSPVSLANPRYLMQ